MLEPLDWEWLLRTGRPHGMLPLLHRYLGACPNTVPASVFAALDDQFQTNARRTLHLAAELLGLVDRFAAHGVAAVPYKGPTVALRCYGDLALRPFRDLDFLIRTRDLPAAERVLAAEGYRPPPGRTPRQEGASRAITCEDAFWRDGDIVELHWAFAPPEFPLPLDLDDVWARLEPLPLGPTLVRTL